MSKVNFEMEVQYIDQQINLLNQRIVEFKAKKENVQLASKLSEEDYLLYTSQASIILKVILKQEKIEFFYIKPIESHIAVLRQTDIVAKLLFICMKRELTGSERCEFEKEKGKLIEMVKALF